MTTGGLQELVVSEWSVRTAPVFQQSLRVFPHGFVNRRHQQIRVFRRQRSQFCLRGDDVGLFPGIGSAGGGQDARMVCAERPFGLHVQGLKKPFAKNLKHGRRTLVVRKPACHNPRHDTSGTVPWSLTAMELHDRSG